MAQKELHYFGSDLDTKVRPSESEYLAQFQNATNKKIVGESSVWYLFSSRAAGEIREFSPDAKILIMLRNPVEVVYSLHSQHLYDGNEDVTDFEAAIDLDEKRRHGMHLADSVDYHKLPPYKDAVMFSAQVKRYLNAFGPGRVHIILYDDFVRGVDQEVSGTLSFLGLQDDVKIDYPVINPNKRIKWFYLHRIIKKPPVALRNIVRWVVPFKKLRHNMMRHASEWNIEPGRRKAMDPELRLRLMNSFREDILELGRTINRDLSAWLK